MKSKYFKRSEFRCKGTDCDLNGNNCGFSVVDVDLLEVLEDIREYFGKPVIINSACRCAKHNFDVGGSQNSMHTKGIAADIRVKDVDSDTVYFYLVNKYQDKFGIGRYNGRVHIDVRSDKARWDSR